ncbi:MAG: hypothetical protein AB7T38_02470 [Nitrospirales bacterium]
MQTVWKYPKDLYAVAVNWAGRYPSGATSLGALLATVFDSEGADVTGTRLVTAVTQGDRSLAYVQGGAPGETYTVKFGQTFNTGRVLYDFVAVEIRNPKTQPVSAFFKYPLDIFDVTVEWLGRLPLRAAQLATLGVLIFDSVDDDVTDTFLLNTQVLGTISVAQIYGGTGGAAYRLELAQAFDDGSIYHDYQTMTVRAPVV